MKYKILIFIYLICVTSFSESVECELKWAALNEGLSPQLLGALCWVESNHNPYVTNFDDNGAHSHGICQIKLATARSVGFMDNPMNLYYVRINARYAAKYLKFQLDRYGGKWIYAVAAYNAGHLYRNKKGTIVNINYVNKVFSNLKEICK